jgi:hypothetical protein
MSETAGVRFGSGEQATSAFGHLPSASKDDDNQHTSQDLDQQHQK